MSAGTIALAFAESILASVLILVAIGFFLAPSLITGYLVADSITAPAARTEASSWINTSVNLGSSLPAAAVGLIVDESSPETALTIGGSTALILTATMWMITRRPAQPDQKQAT